MRSFQLFVCKVSSGTRAGPILATTSTVPLWYGRDVSAIDARMHQIPLQKANYTVYVSLFLMLKVRGAILELSFHEYSLLKIDRHCVLLWRASF